MGALNGANPAAHSARRELQQLVNGVRIGAAAERRVEIDNRDVSGQRKFSCERTGIARVELELPAANKLHGGRS